MPPTVRMPEEDAGLPAWSGRESAAGGQRRNPRPGRRLRDHRRRRRGRHHRSRIKRPDIVSRQLPSRCPVGVQLPAEVTPIGEASAGRLVDIAAARGSRRGGGVWTVDLAGVVGFQSARLAILALNGLVHLLAVYGDLDRGRDPQSNLIAANIHNGDDDVIADDDTFVAVSGQDQHRLRLLPPASEARDRP